MWWPGGMKSTLFNLWAPISNSQVALAKPRPELQTQPAAGEACLRYPGPGQLIVIVAEIDLVPSVTEVAVTVTVPPCGIAASTGSGSSIQVYGTKVNFVESLNGFNFSNASKCSVYPNRAAPE